MYNQLLLLFHLPSSLTNNVHQPLLSITPFTHIYIPGTYQSYNSLYHADSHGPLSAQTAVAASFRTTSTQQCMYTLRVHLVHIKYGPQQLLLYTGDRSKPIYYKCPPVIASDEKVQNKKGKQKRHIGRDLRGEKTDNNVGRESLLCCVISESRTHLYRDNKSISARVNVVAALTWLTWLTWLTDTAN